MHPPLNLSVVVPVLNEEENVEPLCAELLEVLNRLGRDWEVLLVDDGSTDATIDRLRAIADGDSRIRIIRLRRTFGQTAALQAGFHHARHDIIVVLDGDLQNDPADLPRLLELIDDGYDLVHGWRKDRRDPWPTRRLPSWCANRLIRAATGFASQDLGCAMKAIRREIAVELELYGEMHRFIPILAHQQGARCIECAVHHRARTRGTPKYGLDRTVRVLLDLVTVLFLTRFLASPMKLFGRFGLLSGAVAACSGAATVAMKLVSGIDMTGNPLLLLTILSVLAGIQFVGLGLIGELCARIYFSSNRSSYAIREIIQASDATLPLRRAA